MFDHFYVRESGDKVPVAQITDGELNQILYDGGCIIISPDGDSCTQEDIMERCRIEKLIRALKL